MKKFIILQLAGFGDTLSAITRLPAVKEKYPYYEIIFYLGGYGKSVQFSKEQIEREGYKANIIKNFNFHNQIPDMRKFLQQNVVSEGDILEDWSFCEEIFQNKEPVFYKYQMQFPYSYSCSEKNEEVQDKCIAVHPLTKSGNAEGYGSDLENKRFWDRDEWRQLCINLCNNGYTPAFVGYGDEDWGLIEELTTEGYRVLDKRMGVEETISFLQTVDGGVFCNSWDWEVTSRAGIPTFCFYTKNHFFIQNHVPHGPSDFWNNCYIESRSQLYTKEDGKYPLKELGCVKAADVYDKLRYIIDNKERPHVDYDVCMISYNDQDHIARTLNNVKPYIDNKFCVVDGCSTDKTVDIIKHIIPDDKLKLDVVKWDKKFDVQKNNSIKMSEKKWVVFIDADETYEHIFWNQLSWYIRESEGLNIECINVSRINTYNDIGIQELQQFVESKGWRINNFGWVNYPDFQQRVFRNNLRFEGSVHETIKNCKKEYYLYPVNCVHDKSYKKQLKSFKLYKDIENG